MKRVKCWAVVDTSGHYQTSFFEKKKDAIQDKKAGMPMIDGEFEIIEGTFTPKRKRGEYSAKSKH